MSKKNSKICSKTLSALARILVTFVFVFGQTAWAGQGQNAKDKPASDAGAKPQQAPAKPSTAAGEKAASAEEENGATESSSVQESSHRGQQEGIKVHGHWTIEVHNPDGRLVSHREFENSLANGIGGSGPYLLADLLSGNFVSGGLWQIQLSARFPMNPCFVTPSPTVAGPTDCLIVPNAPSFSSLTSTATFHTLQTSAASGQFVLTGTAVAGQVGSISQVFTAVGLCPSNYSPTTCSQVQSFPGGSTFGTFTDATLTQPIQVSTGQTIAVTVTISFS